MGFSIMLCVGVDRFLRLQVIRLSYHAIQAYDTEHVSNAIIEQEFIKYLKSDESSDEPTKKEITRQLNKVFGFDLTQRSSWKDVYGEMKDRWMNS